VRAVPCAGARARPLVPSPPPCTADRLGERRYGLVMLAVAVVGAACHTVTSPNEGLLGLSGIVFALLMLAGGEHVHHLALPDGGRVVDFPVAYVMLAVVFSWQELSQVSRTCRRDLGRLPRPTPSPGCPCAPGLANQRLPASCAPAQWWAGPRTVARLAHAVGGGIGVVAAVLFGRGGKLE